MMESKSLGTEMFVINVSNCGVFPRFLEQRPWQTRTHCCDTNVSPFAYAGNICCGLKFCFRDTKNVFYFVQKHFVSATNVSQFAQPKKNHEQGCVRNNVSSFARALSVGSADTFLYVRPHSGVDLGENPTPHPPPLILGLKKLAEGTHTPPPRGLNPPLELIRFRMKTYVVR